MSQKYSFTSIERVLAKHYRELRGLDIHEGDAIEWIGDALGFMQIPNVSEEAVAFFEVVNYHAVLPCNLHHIIQIAKYAGGTNQLNIQDVIYDGATVAPTVITSTKFALLPNPGVIDTSYQVTNDPDVALNGNYVWNGTNYIKDVTAVQIGVCLNEDGSLVEGTKYAYYRPYFDLQYEYLGWAQSSLRQQAFTPVRLADHSFFNSLVCTEDDRNQYAYNSCEDEYTIVGLTERKLRFSFKEGYVAVAFRRQAIDPQTGYPLIPDDQSCIEAINYYLIWKLMQRMFYLGREGSVSKVDYSEKRWLKYLGQFKNHAFGPFGIDDFEDMKNQGNYMIPRKKMYDNYFGSLSRAEQKTFANPRSNRR